jgi:hypothetical protein
MRRFEVRRVPLLIAAGAFVGSTLVSSVAVASDESPSIDEPVLVIEPAATTPAPAIPPSDDPSTTAEGDIGTIDIGRGSDDMISVAAPDPSFDDIAVVEMVVPDVVAVDGAAMPSEPAGPLSAPASDASPAAEAPDEGHEGGSGGQGNPYNMTFSVTWLDSNGTPIGVLDAVLPSNWRTAFSLSASSETGKGMPTSATCTYPAGSDALECVFDNPGHGSSGLVVPARPTATYTVTVTWPPPDWTIDGANAGPYFARDLCPRGGGQEGDSGVGVDCAHPVVLRQRAAVIVTPVPSVPPATEAEVEAPLPVAAPPAATPTDPATAVAPTATSTRSLAATGGSVWMILLIATLLVTIGSVAASTARRTS